MKKLLYIAILSGFGYLTFSGSGCGHDWATREQLESVRVELRDSIHVVSMKTDRNYRKLDSLERRLSEIEIRLQSLEANQDTLKKGQVLIYSAIKQQDNNPNSVLDQFFDGLSELFTPKYNYK